MNVSLTPELEKMVHEKVASGRYQTASEVVREGLRMIAERDRQRDEDAIWWQKTNRKIAEGVAAANAGNFVEAAEVVRRLKSAAKGKRKKLGAA